VTNRPRPRGYAYSFVNIFSVFDFLVSLGVKPIVEVSFMPSLLASDPDNNNFWYRGGKSKPKDYKDWRDLISALTEALVERYGLSEVESWRFEVWNEPNCGFFDVEQGCCGAGCGNQTSYLEMYTNTWMAIKHTQPSLLVGGPATAQLGWLPWFIEAATKASAPPDFVSSHLYPTDPHIPQTPEGFAKAIHSAAVDVEAARATAGLARPLELLITEFNCGLGIDCADDNFAASFVAQQLVDANRYNTAATTREEAAAARVPFLSYWTFSDIFEEQGQQASEFSQAFGARSIHGVPKPVYRAMQLLRQLGNASLAEKDFNVTLNGTKAWRPHDGSGVDVVVTASGEAGAFRILVVNQPAARPDSTPVPGGTAVKIQWPSANGETSRGELRRVDAVHSNALPTYEAIGRPVYPNSTQLDELRAASEIKTEPLTVQGVGGGWQEVSVVVPRFGMALLSITV
jgi:xylan 1,4-beta-xylosidase